MFWNWKRLTQLFPIFFFTNWDALFVDKLISFYRARLSRRLFKARAIARFWNQFLSGQKTIGSHLKHSNFPRHFLRMVNCSGRSFFLWLWVRFKCFPISECLCSSIHWKRVGGYGQHNPFHRDTFESMNNTLLIYSQWFGLAAILMSSAVVLMEKNWAQIAVYSLSKIVQLSLYNVGWFFIVKWQNNPNGCICLTIANLLSIKAKVFCTLFALSFSTFFQGNVTFSRFFYVIYKARLQFWRNAAQSLTVSFRKCCLQGT